MTAQARGRVQAWAYNLPHVRTIEISAEAHRKLKQLSEENSILI